MQHRNRTIVAALVIAGLPLAACSESEAPAHIAPATVEHIEGTDVSRVILSAKAAERLGVETATVEEREVVRKRTPGGEVVPTPTDKVAGLDAVWVRVTLNDSDLQKVDRNQPALVLSGDDPESGLPAKAADTQALGDLTETPGALYYVVEGAGEDLVPGQRVRVETPLSGSGTQKIVPHSAVIYGAHGETWVYTSPEPLIFVRQPVTVDYVEGDLAVLAEGPPAGTAIATVGVPEIFGAEFEVGH